MPMAKSLEWLWDGPQAIKEFLEGLKTVLETVQPGVYKAVCAMLKSPIRAALEQTKDNASKVSAGLAKSTEHWLCAEYQQLELEHNLPPWSSCCDQEDGEWTKFEMSALKVWLHCKVRADCQEGCHVTGVHSGEHEKQFTQTDRIVKSLMELEAFSEEASNDGSSGKLGEPEMFVHCNNQSCQKGPHEIYI